MVRRSKLRQTIVNGREDGVDSKQVRVNSGFVSRIREDIPVLRAAIIFFLLLAFFYGVLHTPAGDYRILRWHLRSLATGSARILSDLGYDATVEGVVIRTPQFAVQVARGCDAIEPLALFFAAVLSSPLRRWWRKIPGILIGGLILLFVNTARIVTLVIIRIHFPSIFQDMHERIWQAAFIILVIVLWASWAHWATQPMVQKGRVR